MRAPRNSFAAPIKGMWEALDELVWEFPFVHVVGAAFAIVVVLAVLIVLYPTVGIFLQVTSTLATVTDEAYRRLKTATSFEVIGHATAVGVLFLIYLPFAVIGWPLYWMAAGFKGLFERLVDLLDQPPGGRP